MTYIFINLFLQIDEAAMAALEEKETSAESSDASSWTIKEAHFQPALAKIIPSITETVYIDCLFVHYSSLLSGHKTIHTSIFHCLFAAATAIL